MVLDFLQKPSPWFWKFYLRVQSKNCGKNSFFCSLFRVFSNYERMFFRLLAKKLRKKCKNYLLRVQTNNFWLEETFKSFESFWIFCRHLRHGSQNSIYVSRVKIALENFFYFYFQNFFGFWAKNFWHFRPKIFKKLSKLPSACPQEQLVALYLFKKFWTVLDFLQKPLARFSKFYLRVERKICGRKKFFILPFWIFFGFLAKRFSDFWPKNFMNLSKLPSTCPEEQFVAWIFILSFESFRIFCRKPWHGSQKPI